jgi:hypothetical protein
MNIYEKAGAFASFAGGVMMLCGYIPLGQYYVDYWSSSWTERDQMIAGFRALSISGTIILLLGAALFLYGIIYSEAEKKAKAKTTEPVQ